MGSSAPAQHQPRLQTLLQFLQQDPANTSLLADAALCAFEENALDLSTDLIERYAAMEPPPSALLNLKGLIAIAQQRFADSAAVFADLRDHGFDDPILRFNLAWSRAMTGAYREALDLLDDDAVTVSSLAPKLKIQMMHHLGLLDEALACGETLAARYPDDQDLMGALAALAIDAGKQDLAMQYAERAGSNADGRAALAVLALGEHDVNGSLVLFEQALQQQPQNPRAWVGKGLGLLISGESAAGAEAIDRGAELFRTHTGSWVASGWAHFTNRDYAGARRSFERALALDPNFSESHGGLAVLDILDGKMDDAAKRSEIALRLDKNSLGGALAKSLLLERSGHARIAEKIRETAMSTPIGPGGQTLAQALVGFNTGLRQ